jgi:ribosomal protein L14E/L6E/L27E
MEKKVNPQEEIIKYLPALEKLKNKSLFPKKVEQAKAMLQKIKEQEQAQGSH